MAPIEFPHPFRFLTTRVLPLPVRQRLVGAAAYAYEGTLAFGPLIH